MPYDQAIYVPSVDKIVAVRSGHAYLLDPDTTTCLRREMFDPAGEGQASLVYAASIDKLIVSCWNKAGQGVIGNIGQQRPDNKRYIYWLDPATLAVTHQEEIMSQFSGGTSYCQPSQGVKAMTYRDGKVYATMQLSDSSDDAWVVSFDPADLPGTKYNWDSLAQGAGQTDIAVDRFAVGEGPQREAVWVTDQQDLWVWGIDWDSNSPTFEQQVRTAVVPGFVPLGVTTDIFGSVWVAGHSRYVYRYNATAPEFTSYGDMINHLLPLAATIDTGRLTLKANHIRYNQYDTNLYVPGGSDNSITVIEPYSNTCSSLEGFDLPFDFLFLPWGTIYAVQRGHLGLKKLIYD